jgi:hypothetical protein
MHARQSADSRHSWRRGFVGRAADGAMVRQHSFHVAVENRMTRADGLFNFRLKSINYRAHAHLRKYFGSISLLGN